jgi:hypothetical protein
MEAKVCYETKCEPCDIISIYGTVDAGVIPNGNSEFFDKIFYWG